MKTDLIKLPALPFDPAEDAASLCALAAELHAEVQGTAPRHRNHYQRLMFVLRTLKRSEVLSSTKLRRLTWRERITGRLQA